MGKINSKKVVIDGIEFDSTTEGEFYQYLMSNKENLGIKEIELQPFFQLIPGFNVNCDKCVNGYIISQKTGNRIKCRKCKGEGINRRNPWTYTADFLVTYENNKPLEVIDVKGFANEKFPLVKKMFEWTHKHRLTVVEKSKKGWVRK